MKGKEPNREPEPIPQEPLEPQCRLGTANREPAEPNRQVGSELALSEAWNLPSFFCPSARKSILLSYIQARNVFGSG